MTVPEQTRSAERPSPEALLAEAEAEHRGKLKIFLGAAPGVGKTYEMLQAAAARRREGADVVIGVVETHGRVETGQLARGFETIPRRRVEYRGRVIDEIVLDAKAQGATYIEPSFYAPRYAELFGGTEGAVELVLDHQNSQQYQARRHTMRAESDEHRKATTDEHADQRDETRDEHQHGERRHQRHAEDVQRHRDHHGVDRRDHHASPDVARQRVPGGRGGPHPG